MIQKRTSLFILIFALCGALAAAFSLYEHTLLQAGAMTGPSLCNIGGQFNCDAINRSEYSTVFGVPLAQIGLGYYLILAIGALVSFFSAMSVATLGVLLIASTFSVIASIYLFCISKFVIGYFCLFCMVMYISNIAIFFTSYRASRGSIGHILHNGLFAPGEFLINLIKGTQKFYSWSFLVLSLLSLYGVYRAPGFLVPSTLMQKNPQASAYLAAWKKEPIVSLSVHQGNAINGDYTTGNLGASIQIVEYSDFECPACRMFYPKIEKVLEKYRDKVSFTPKNFPLDKTCNRMVQKNIHLHSCELASFVRCSGEQGKFWEAYHQVFTESTIDKSRESDQVMQSLMSWASGAGIDTEALQSCVSSGRQLEKIKSEVEEAISFEIQGTPTIFINGRRTNPLQLDDIVGSLVNLQGK